MTKIEFKGRNLESFDMVRRKNERKKMNINSEDDVINNNSNTETGVLGFMPDKSDLEFSSSIIPKELLEKDEIHIIHENSRYKPV